MDKFINLIDNAVGNVKDSFMQKQSEAQLKHYLEQNPNQYIQMLLNILKNADKPEHRIFAATNLRKNLSSISEACFENVWEKINSETKQIVKTTLFACLDTEPASNIRDLISDAIGEIGGSLMQDQEINSKKSGQVSSHEWPELVNLCWQLFLQENSKYVIAGFRILTNLILFASEHFIQYTKELHTLFGNGLKNQESQIKQGALECLSSYVGNLEWKHAKNMQDLLGTVMEAVKFQVNTDAEGNGEESLEILIDIAESEPKFFKHGFDNVFQQIWEIFSNQNLDNDNIKRSSVELLICIVERVPSLVRKKQQILKQIVEMVFFYMIQIEEEITEDWQKPKEGFNDDVDEDADFETTRFGMNSINRLISTVGEKEVLPQISLTVQNLLQSADWRYQYTAIMALSQVGEHLDDVNDVAPIVTTVMKFLDSQNPKIRFSVCHCIGQMSDDLKPDFQEQFAKQIVPALMSLIDIEPIPRVQSHAFQGLNNILEGQENADEVTLILQPLLQKILNALNGQNTISIVKEGALACLASLAESAKDKFVPYLPDSVKLLYNVFNTHHGKQYTVIRGLVIEALTVIADSTPDAAIFKPFIPQTVQLFLSVNCTGSKGNQENENDGIKKYILVGWQRLCQQYSQDLVEYLPQVVPQLLQLVRYIAENDNIENDEGGSKTFAQDELEAALAMLQVFIDSFIDHYAPYVAQTTEIVVPLCEYKRDMDIRDAASRCLPGLAKATKNYPSDCQKLIRLFMETIYRAAENEFDAEVVQAQIYSMKECLLTMLEQGPFLTVTEVNQLSEKVLKLLMKSDERKCKNEDYKVNYNGELEEDELDMVNYDQEQEEELHVQIADFFGAIFKTHQMQSQELATLLYSQILPKVMGDNVSHRMHKFGIFLIDDMLEYLGFDLCGQDRWNDFYLALVKFSTNQNAAVRQAAVYGIGEFAQRTPQDKFASQYASRLIQSLYDAINVPKSDQETEKQHGHARDNAIASLGKMIKAQGGNTNTSINLMNYLPQWLSFLPLRFDKPEAHLQHEFLADIILQNPELLLTSESQYFQVINIFGQILDTKLCNEAVKLKISQCLKFLAQQPYVKQNWDTLVQKLEDVQKQRLINCANMPQQQK